MARLIGMDEAGLGPNLGPFVVALTVWQVPESPQKFDFWGTFRRVLTNCPEDEDRRLHVADSKQMFQPHCGLGGLERGVLAAMRLLGHDPRCATELYRLLTSPRPDDDQEPLAQWYQNADIDLPTESHDSLIADEWKACCEEQQVQLLTIKAAIVEPGRFNRLIRLYDNKSLVVSRIAFELLRSVWSPNDEETFIIGDKHGGRNRYDQLLAEVLDGEMIFRLRESAERSDYRVGNTLLRFQPRAEEHGPVALASMVAKYVRELTMTKFNRFWARHIDGLKPTQGYPVDAARFRKQITVMQQQLGITDDELWRVR